MRASAVYVSEKLPSKYSGSEVKGIYEYMGSTAFKLVTREGQLLVKLSYSSSINNNFLEVCVDDTDLHLACENAIKLTHEKGYKIHTRRNEDGTQYFY